METLSQTDLPESGNSDEENDLSEKDLSTDNENDLPDEDNQDLSSVNEDLSLLQEDHSQQPPVAANPTKPHKITPDDPRLSEAIAQVESSGNERAVGPMTKYGTAKGAHQFLDATWKQYGEGGDVYNKQDSAKATTKYLSHLYNKFDGDINLTIAAFHAGEGNVDTAIKKAGSNDYSNVAQYLGPNTRNYVPAVLGKYNAGSPELAEKVNAAKRPGVLDDTAFSEQLAPIITSPEYQSLSASDQIKTINNIYQKNIYAPKVGESLKKLSEQIWSGASPEELTVLQDEFGTPDRGAILASGKNPDAYLNDWKNKKLSEFKRMGIAPELLNKPFTDYFNSIKADEDEAYQIRSQGSIGRWTAYLGNNLRNAAKGVIDFPAGIDKAVADGLGANAFGTTIAKVPDQLLGMAGRDSEYMVDDKGYILINDDGTPRTRWETNLFRGVGTLLGTVGTGAALKLADLSTAQVGARLFTANALMNGDSAFSSVYEQTGDKKKAYTAALLSLPASAVDTLTDVSLLSKYTTSSITGLSKFNQAKILAATAAGGAVKGAVGISAQDILLQGAEISQTGQAFSPQRTESAALVGAVGGALIAPFAKNLTKEVASLDDAGKIQADHAVKTELNSTLQEFQNSHDSTLTVDVNEKHITPEVLDALGITAAPETDGKVTFTKNDFVPDSSKTPQEALDNTLKYLTPNEIRDLSAERAELLSKFRDNGASELDNKEVYHGGTEESVSRETPPETDVSRETPIKPGEEIYRPLTEAESVPHETKGVQLTKGERPEPLSKLETELRDTRQIVQRGTDGIIKRLETQRDARIATEPTAKGKEQHRQFFDEEIAKAKKDYENAQERLKELPKLIENEKLYHRGTEDTRTSTESGKFTAEDRARLDELDTKLKDTYDPNYLNKLRANELDYLSKAIDAGEILPVKFDKEKGGFVNLNTGEVHPFLKGALEQEEFAKPTKDRASTTLPKAEFLPKAYPKKPLSDKFIQPEPFKPTNTTPTSTKAAVESIQQLGKLLGKIEGLPAYTLKEGGRLRRNVLGTATPGAKVVRVRSLRNIPTLVHEYTHALDFTLQDITQHELANDPVLSKALVEQARTFYPGKAVNKDRTLALREGITMFVENKLTRQPVHQDLLNWWNGKFKQQHPDIWNAYDHIEKLADAYYSQTLEARTKALTLDETPGRLARIYRAVTDINNWIAATDKDIAFRELDKAMGLTGRYNNKSYRAFIEANDHSAQLVAHNLIQGDHYTDFYGNRIPEQKTLKQIFSGLNPEQQDALSIYLDMHNAATMIRRQQNPGLSSADVQANIEQLIKRPDAPLIEQKAEEVYRWWERTQDQLVQNSPAMRNAVERIRASNLVVTGKEHGYYVPFERQEKPGGIASGKGNEQTPNPASRRVGSDRPLKPLTERYENLVRNWTEASLKNQLIDRLIFDYRSGKATGGMLQQISPRQALKFQTTYAEMLKKASAALDKTTGMPGLSQGELLGASAEIAGKSGKSADKILNTVLQWWTPETSLSGKNAANGYKILARMRPDGKRFDFFEVHPNLMEAFAGPDRSYDNSFVQASRLAKRAVQVSATALNPGFHARNILKDVQTSLLLGKEINANKVFQHIGSELIDQVVTKTTGRQTGAYAIAQNLGLSSATYMGAMKEINYIAHDKGILTNLWKAGDKALNAVEFLTSLDENANRLARMRITLERQGLDLSDPNLKLTPLQAIDAALAYKNATVNFSKRGSNKAINFLTDVTPFFGARLAASAQTIEAVKEHPQRALAFGTALFGLGLYNYLQNAGKDWFDELSPESKSAAFTMDLKQPNGRTKVTAIPLDDFMATFFGLGQIAAKQFHENVKGGDIEASTVEMIRAILQKDTPLDLPLDSPGILTTVTSGFGPVGKQLAEQAMNKKLFENRPIVDEHKVPSEQFTEKTSELMKGIGRVTGMAPDRVEYFVKSFASGPLSIEKFFEKQTGVKPVNEDAGVNFLLRAFTREASNAAIQDESSRKFYDAIAASRQQKSTETEEQGNSRKFLERAARKLTEVNKLIAATPDPVQRDKLYTLRREMYRAGIRSMKNPNQELPTLDTVENQ